MGITQNLGANLTIHKQIQLNHGNYSKLECELNNPQSNETKQNSTTMGNAKNWNFTKLTSTMRNIQ